MQLSSINPVGFQGSSYGWNDDVIDASYREIPLDDKYDRFEKAVDDSKQNIHVSTVFAGIAAMAAAFKGSQKIVGLVSKAGLKVGEVAASSSVKVANFVSENVSKILKKENPLANKAQGAIEAIKNKADSLRLDVGDVKMMSTVRNVATDIIGEEKANKLVNFVGNTLGVYNKQTGIKALIAGAFALKAGDKIPDIVEDKLDARDIQQQLGEILLA